MHVGCSCLCLETILKAEFLDSVVSIAQKRGQLCATY